MVHTEYMQVRPLAQHVAGDTAVSTYMVCIIIYSTKEQCGQITVERAFESYLLSLLRS